MKRVLVRCFGPIVFYKSHKSLWEDVYLKWKGKPGRKVYQTGPTLIGKINLMSDLSLYQSDIEFKDDEIRLLEALKGINISEYFIDKDDNIYSRSDKIDRFEAEKMLLYYFKSKFNVTNVKFKWMKPKFFVISL